GAAARRPGDGPRRRGRAAGAAALLLAASLLAAACGGGGGGGSTASGTPAGTRSNTLIYAMDTSDAVSLDPAVAYESTSVFVAHQAYSTLVTFRGSDLTKPVGDLAESWQVSPDGKVWTFHLKSGLRFANGDPLTAGDVAYSFDRAVQLNQGPAWLLTQFGIAKGSTVATDDRTVQIHLAHAVSPNIFLSVLTFPVAAVVNPREVQAHEKNGDMGQAWLNGHSAGSGPYILTGWQREAQITLEANPNYYGEKPAMKTVLIKHMPETTNQLTALQRGDIDIAHNLSPDQLRSLEGARDVQVVDGLNLGLVYLGMNAGMAPFDKKEVRQAVRYAIDYQGLIQEIVQGHAIPVQGIEPSGIPGFDPEQPYAYDPAKAKELLRAAGASDVTVDLLAPTGPDPTGADYGDIAAKVKNDLEQVGIHVHVQQMTQAALLAKYRAQEAQMVLMGWFPDYPDPDANAQAMGVYENKELAYRLRYKNDQVAALVRQAAAESDAARREALYRQINQMMMEDGPFAVLYQPKKSVAMRADIEGYAYNPQWTVDLAAIRRK
ncbi:MAG: ABC transporter substrate-binding protein, partial [Clostridia bacterium]|nr:ABC transporter substrate-binding protein [Clostridia bacterium]